MDLSEMRYSSGEAPTIGDKVKIAADNTFDYYSDIRRSNGVFEVIEVMDGVKTRLVRLKNSDGSVRANRVSAKNLQLVSSMSGDSNESSPPRFMIFSKGKARGAAATEAAMQTKLTDLLTAEPTAHFHIFEYNSTAKAARPQVEFVNAREQAAMAAGRTPPAQKTPNPVSADEFFRKL